MPVNTIAPAGPVVGINSYPGGSADNAVIVNGAVPLVGVMLKLCVLPCRSVPRLAPSGKFSTVFVGPATLKLMNAVNVFDAVSVALMRTVNDPVFVGVPLTTPVEA